MPFLQLVPKALRARVARPPILPELTAGSSGSSSAPDTAASTAYQLQDGVWPLTPEHSVCVQEQALESDAFARYAFMAALAGCIVLYGEDSNEMQVCSHGWLEWITSMQLSSQQPFRARMPGQLCRGTSGVQFVKQPMSLLLTCPVSMPTFR